MSAALWQVKYIRRLCGQRLLSKLVLQENYQIFSNHSKLFPGNINLPQCQTSSAEHPTHSSIGRVKIQPTQPTPPTPNPPRQENPPCKIHSISSAGSLPNPPLMLMRLLLVSQLVRYRVFLVLGRYLHLVWYTNEAMDTENVAHPKQRRFWGWRTNKQGDKPETKQQQQPGSQEKRDDTNWVVWS